MSFPSTAVYVDLYHRLSKWVISHFLSSKEKLTTLRKSTIAYSLAIFMVVLSMAVGVWTLWTTPVLVAQPGFNLPADKASIKEIHLIDLGEDYFIGFPLFLRRADEKRWWRTQKIMTGVMLNQREVELNIIDSSGKKTIPVTLEPLTLRQVILRIGLNYLIVLIFIAYSIREFTRSYFKAKVLSWLFLSFALFFAAISPLVDRNFILSFPSASILFFLQTIAVTGLITLLHFASLYPKEKFAEKYSKNLFPYFVYGYPLFVNLLYLFGIISLAITVILVTVLVSGAVALLTHTVLVEKNIFIRKQLKNCIYVILALAAAATLFYFPNEHFGSAATQLTYFALFSLMLPFTLTSAVENINLFATHSHKTTVHLPQIEHKPLTESTDTACTYTTIFAHLVPNLFTNKDKPLRVKIQSIKTMMARMTRETRYFLWITAERNISWQEYFHQLKKYGEDITRQKQIRLQFSTQIDQSVNAPALTIRIGLYYFFSETLQNALFQAKASSVYYIFHITQDWVTVEMALIGEKSFTQGWQNRAQLNLLVKQIKEHHGEFEMSSEQDEEVYLKASLPL